MYSLTRPSIQAIQTLLFIALAEMQATTKANEFMKFQSRRAGLCGGSEALGGKGEGSQENC